MRREEKQKCVNHFSLRHIECFYLYSEQMMMKFVSFNKVVLSSSNDMFISLNEENSLFSSLQKVILMLRRHLCDERIDSFNL